MFRPRVIPVLLLQNKGLVKTVGFKDATYIGDPINCVKIFNELHADELIFLDIRASQEGRSISPETVTRIGNEAFMPFAVGGGISTIEQVRNLIAAGAEKVVINSQAILQPQFIKEASLECGSQSIVVSIDVKKNLFGKAIVYSHGGKKSTSKDPLSWAMQVTELGAGEIMLNSIDHDGKMQGYAYEWIERICEAVPIPVIACGGAGKLDDLRFAIEAGAHAAAAGSLFVYHGSRKGVLINYPERTELEQLFK